MRGAESFREPPLTLTVLHTIGVEAQHPGSERVLTVLVEPIGAASAVSAERLGNGTSCTRLRIKPANGMSSLKPAARRNTTPRAVRRVQGRPRPGIECREPATERR